MGNSMIDAWEELTQRFLDRRLCGAPPLSPPRWADPKCAVDRQLNVHVEHLRIYCAYLVNHRLKSMTGSGMFEVNTHQMQCAMRYY
jgi:hypothetical protein